MCNSVKTFIIVIVLVNPNSALRLDLGEYDSKNFNFTCPSAAENPKINFLENQWPGNGTIQGRNHLILECLAAYPIYWDFLLPNDVFFGLSSKVSTKGNNFRNGSGLCYRIELDLAAPASFSGIFWGRSGNYSCISMNGNKSASKYVYSQDNSRIFSSLQVYETYSRLVQGDWLIPCSTNLKEEYLTLNLGKPGKKSLRDESLKMTTNSSNNLMYPGDSSIRFDSELGFLLPRAHHSRPKGLYLCAARRHSTSKSIPDIVIVNMTNYHVIPEGDYVQYTNVKQITLVCESDEEIFIDTTKAHKLIHIKQFIQGKTESFNYSITHTWEETVDPNVDGKEGEISCKVKGSNKILHTWKHDARRMCNVTINFHGLYNDNNGYNIQFNFQTVVDDNSTNWVPLTVKYNSCITKAQCDLALRYFDRINRGNIASFVADKRIGSLLVHIQPMSTVFQCIIDNKYISMTLAVAGTEQFDLNLATRTSEANKINVTTMIDIGNIFIGDSVPFLCKASKYFYNQGIHWELVFKNGTRAIADSNSDIGSVMYLGLLIKASLLTIISKDVVAVACSASIWNSTEWDSRQFRINSIDKPIWDENSAVKCGGDANKPTLVMKRRSHEGRYSFYSNDVYLSLRPKLASHVVTDSDIIFQNGNEEFYLQCIAVFPVEWVASDGQYLSFVHPQQESGLGTVTANETHLHRCFQSSIHINAYGSANADQTGEYRCVKTNEKNKYGYAYIYMNVSNGGLLNRGEHIIITINDSNPYTILPCRVSDPSLAVNLYYHEDQGHYRKLNKSSDVGYDPKIGFFLKTASLNSSALYICATSNKTDGTDALSFAFHKNTTFINGKTTATLSQNKSFIVVEFFFVLLLFVTVICFQLWFLKKQVKIDNVLSRILGSHITVGPEVSANVFDRLSSNDRRNVPSLI